MTLIEAAIACAPVMFFLALCISEPSFSASERRFHRPHDHTEE